MIDAAKINVARPVGQRATIHVWTRTMQKITKSIPCAKPTIRTASGMFHTYFKGIARNRRTRNETPSIWAIVRKSAIGFFIWFVLFW